jgi:hypothetical protein
MHDIASSERYIETPNRSIEVGGTAFAYRDLGPRGACRSSS